MTPKGVAVVIMTRWHQDDLVGRLLDVKRQADMREAGFGDEVWEECCMPALAHSAGDPLGRQPGEALFPERYDVKRLKAIRAVIGAYQWAALYDGNPKPKSGNYISRDNIRKVSAAAVPWTKTHMRYWDLAVKETETSDYHAGARGCLGDDGTFFIVHIERMHTSWPKAKAKVKEHAEKEMILTGVEAIGAFDIAFVEIRGACRPDVPLQKFSFVRDKLTRALPWFALADPEAGFKVAIVEGDWNEAFLSEIEEFPKGLHDDQVDAVSGLYQMLTSSRGLLLA